MPVNTPAENARIMLRYNEHVTSKFMSAADMDAAKRTMNAGHTTGSNATAEGAAPLWTIVSKPVASNVEKLLAPLSAMAKNVRDTLPFGVGLGSTLANIKLKVIDSVGTVKKNPVSIQESALASHTVGLNLNTYFLTAGLNYAEIQNGETIDQYLDSMYEQLAQSIFAEVVGTVAAAAPTLTGADIPAAGGKIGVLHVDSAADVTPTYVTKKVGTVFKPRGKVDSLVLDVDSYANLIPTNADFLEPRPGQYHIGQIFESGGIEGVDGATPGTGIGFAMRGRSVGYVAAPYDITSNTMQTVEMAPLGDIPVRLLITTDDNTQTVYHTLVAVFGCAVVKPDDVAVISTGSAPAA